MASLDIGPWRASSRPTSSSRCSWAVSLPDRTIQVDRYHLDQCVQGQLLHVLAAPVRQRPAVSAGHPGKDRFFGRLVLLYMLGRVLTYLVVERTTQHAAWRVSKNLAQFATPSQ